MTDPSFEIKVPEGDDKPRQVCTSCGFIHYENPRVIVGTVSVWEGKVLLCRRAIEPREGYWTLPAGFMEKHETTEEGAARETFEESGARVEIGALLGVYNVPHISQVHLYYLAEMLSPDLDPGFESHEAKLFTLDEIPRDQLAFQTTHWALEDFARHPSEPFAPFNER